MNLCRLTRFPYIAEPDNPKKVLVRKLVLVSEGQTEKELDLTVDLSKLKQTVFTIKEGVQYRIRIEFFVQHEIVTGLKYVQRTYRKGIQGESTLLPSCSSNLAQISHLH